MDIYAQNILDRYKQPFYRERKIDADIEGAEANHSCGDRVSVRLETADNKIKDYSFNGAGCAVSMAAADMIGDLIEGMNTEEILKLRKEDIYEILGIEISVRRSKCALLTLMAIQNAILENQGRGKKSWPDYHI